MANLLRLVLELAEDEEARRRFRAEPHAALRDIDDLCAEDVSAAVDVVRVQVAPGVAERLTGSIGMRPAGEADERQAAVHALLSLCDAAGAPARAMQGGNPVPERPPAEPGRPSHLWAVDGRGETDDDGPEERDHAVPLAPVPDPPGGFEYGPLELVRLPAGVPDAGIEPGALATVVAVHRDPELRYEIEVSGDDGARRFLGTVPPSSLDRY